MKSPNQQIREIRFYWDRFIAYMSIHLMLYVMCFTVGMVAIDVSMTREVIATMLIAWVVPNGAFSLWMWFNKE
jgi:hypothetical protein